MPAPSLSTLRELVRILLGNALFFRSRVLPLSRYASLISITIVWHRPLVDDANSSAANQFLDLIDEKSICGDQAVVWLEHRAKLTRLFKIEQ